MKVVFRVDASQLIGSGHVMRCLALAEYLLKHHAQVFFICRELPGNMIKIIEERRFPVFRLPYKNTGGGGVYGGKKQYVLWLGVLLEKELYDVEKYLTPINKIDWLIVDHYALDEKWEEALRKYTQHIMVIDDLANRKHVCDFLLDQNYYAALDKRYDGLVPPKCRSLLGPKYVLLRNEFVKARKKIKVCDGNVRRILVFLGGADLTNETKKVLDALSMIGFLGVVDVVVGAQNRHKSEIRSICAGKQNYNFYFQVDNIVELMLQADLAIGAGGVSVWERCCLGLPSLVITLAENQERLAHDTHAFGAIAYLGKSDQLTVNELAVALENNIYDSTRMKSMSQKGMLLVDGLGVQRVGEYVTI